MGRNKKKRGKLKEMKGREEWIPEGWDEGGDKHTDKRRCRWRRGQRWLGKPWDLHTPTGACWGRRRRSTRWLRRPSCGARTGAHRTLIGGCSWALWVWHTHLPVGSPTPNTLPSGFPLLTSISKFPKHEMREGFSFSYASLNYVTWHMLRIFPLL